MASLSAIYAAIETALTDLGEFATVSQRSAWPQKGRYTCPAALIRRVTETERVIGCAPVTSDVDCTYELTIVCEAEDELERADECRRLAALCQNVLTGSSLAGLTKPDLTRAGKLRHDTRATHPYARIFITCEFQYETTQTGHEG